MPPLKDEPRPRAFPTRPATVADWQARLRTALFEALDEQAIREVVDALIAKAKKGDVQAARLLLTYAVGSPTVSVQNAVILTEAERPTGAMPQTPEKIRVMQERARQGLPLTHPADARPGGRDGDG